MYPITFEKWLRLKAALTAFLAGSISYPVLYLLGLDSEWYSQVPILLLFGGLAYTFYIGEWERVLYKRRKDPETRPKIVRAGTILFLAGLTTPVILDLPPIEDLVKQNIPDTALLITYGLMVGIGAITITWGIFDNCKKLPARAERSARNALRMMKEAGYEIRDDPLWVGLDPAVRSAAHNYPAEGGNVILVNPKYVNTKWFGGLDNILVHEMSHIYGRATNRPWENPEIVKDLEAKYKTARNYHTKGYLLKTLVRSAFDLGEVLTDDLAYKVLEKSKITWVEPTRESLQTLVRSRPGLALRTKRKQLKNAMLIAKNSICIAEMDRHNIPDTEDKAKKANQKLMSALPEEAARAYKQLHQIALELEENLTEADYKTLLGNYLGTLVEFAEAQPGRV